VASSSDEEDANSKYPKFVTLMQFAELFGVTYQTALRWKNDKKIHVITVGGRHRVYRQELERFEREGNRGA
jgi:excisionase family DNA binding protein